MRAELPNGAATGGCCTERCCCCGWWRWVRAESVSGGRVRLRNRKRKRKRKSILQTVQGEEDHVHQSEPSKLRRMTLDYTMLWGIVFVPKCDF